MNEGGRIIGSYEKDGTSSGSCPMAAFAVNSVTFHVHYVLPHYAVPSYVNISALSMHVLSVWLCMNMTQGDRYRLSIADITLTVVSVDSVATQQNTAATGRNSCSPKKYIFEISRDTISNFSQVHVNSLTLNILCTSIVRYSLEWKIYPFYIYLSDNASCVNIWY
jgi:hypothetical protein